MRKRRKSANADAEVPMSAMIDVVFLLLIYFIVSQKPITEDTLLPCDLPSPGQPTKSEKPPRLLNIDVFRMNINPKKDMDIYGFNQNAVKFSDLKNVLKQTAKNDPEQTIIINCDPNALHEKLIQLLDACQEFGLTKLNLTNDATIPFQPINRK